LKVTGGGNLIVRFHPSGKPREELAVHEPLLGYDHGGGGGGTGRGRWSGKQAEIRMYVGAGVHEEVEVEAEGYERTIIGRVEVHADRPTEIDVELVERKK
jgi:hypothetical protein